MNRPPNALNINWGFTCGNSPQSEASCSVASNSSKQNALNSMSGGEPSSMKSTVTVVTFNDSNATSPVTPTTLSMNNVDQ